MIFKYTPVTPQISRPLIRVRLIFKEKFLVTTSLIDSGADYCIFPIDYAFELSIPISKSKRTIFSSFSGESSSLYLHPVQLSIEAYSAEILAGFTESIGMYSYSVLGQKGFFDNFKVCFDKSKLQVEMTPK